MAAVCASFRPEQFTSTECDQGERRMPAAARVGDLTTHPGTLLGPGVPSVLIGGRPAAVLGTAHSCASPPPNAHVPSTIIRGSSSVRIGGNPAARVGDAAGCTAAILGGALSVIVGG